MFAEWVAERFGRALSACWKAFFRPVKIVAAGTSPESKRSACQEPIGTDWTSQAFARLNAVQVLLRELFVFA